MTKIVEERQIHCFSVVTTFLNVRQTRQHEERSLARESQIVHTWSQVAFNSNFGLNATYDGYVKKN